MENYKKHFEEGYSDSEIYLIGKREFKHEEGSLTFKYRYVVTVIDMEEITDEDLPVTVELSLVVTPSSMTQERRKDIAYTNGMEDEEDYVPSFEDVVMEGVGITFGRYAVEGVEGDMLEDKRIQEILEEISKKYETMDSMRGFYLDRPWNRIGTTGWDMLEHLVLGEELFKW